MRTNIKTMFGFMMVAIFTLSLLAFTTPDKVSDDWGMPAKYKTMKNPLADEGDPDDIGGDLYKQHCRSCHGKEGYGDGTKAGELEAEMRDFSGPAVQEQSDGELYYKSFIGKDEMPNFEKKIRDEEDRWYVINYIRTLAE